MKVLQRLILSAAVIACPGCSRSQPQGQAADFHPVELQQQLTVPFRFVAYGDTRFTDPHDTEASNPDVRRALVKAIGDAHPAFISIGGDIAYNGYDSKDWHVWDVETSIWRDNKIPVYPAIGNHDLHGELKLALANYFQRFPDLHNSRYYSLRAANLLMLVLDTALDETTGPQSEWLAHKLDTIPPDIDFVCLVFHHPPYTSSSDEKKFGGGHSARTEEQRLAKMLEARQKDMRSRIVVFNGHVHNYERHEHGGITYFVTGGGGAHAYPIERAPDDLFQSKQVNYHYLLVEVNRQEMKVTMNRLDLSSGKAVWTQPDSVIIHTAEAKAAGVATR